MQRKDAFRYKSTREHVKEKCTHMQKCDSVGKAKMHAQTKACFNMQKKPMRERECEGKIRAPTEGETCKHERKQCTKKKRVMDAQRKVNTYEHAREKCAHKPNCEYKEGIACENVGGGVW